MREANQNLAKAVAKATKNPKVFLAWYSLMLCPPTEVPISIPYPEVKA